MFVYFYNSFQAFEIPICLGKSTCLSLTYLWLKCLRFQERKQRGTLMCLSLGLTGLPCPRTQLGKGWWSGSPAPSLHPHPTPKSSTRSALCPRTSFLSMARCVLKRIKLGTFVSNALSLSPGMERADISAQERAPWGQTGPSRARHPFSVFRL